MHNIVKRRTYVELEVTTAYNKISVGNHFKNNKSGLLLSVLKNFKSTNATKQNLLTQSLECVPVCFS